MKSPLPSEHIEQVTFVTWFRNTYPTVRIFAIPNGGLRAKTTASKLKAEGVVSGVPDLFIPKWNLWIEMKRQKGSTTSKEQKDWIKYLAEECGHHCIIGKGWEHAAEEVRKWIKTKNG